jgi:hypothetical protein
MEISLSNFPGYAFIEIIGGMRWQQTTDRCSKQEQCRGLDQSI